MSIIKKIFGQILPNFTNMELNELWDVKVRIIDKKTKEPIGGEGYTIEFYDKDELDVDFLGKGSLNAEGIADVRFDPAAMNSGFEDTEEPETDPDIFFIIKKDGEEVYKSAVTYNINYERDADFDLIEGKEFYLGTFLIDID